MSFPANSNIVILLTMAHVFLLLYMSGNLWLDASHYDFYLIACKVILPSYSMDFCCGIKLFGNKLLLSRASLYGLLGESKTVCNLRANCSPQLRQGLPECPTQCPGIRRFSNLTGWEQVFCRPCGSAQYCYSWSLWGALSPASASCLTCTVQYSAEHCWETLCKCWTFTLCAILFSLVLCSEMPSLLAVPILSAPSS